VQALNPFHLLVLATAVSMLIIPIVWRFAPRLGLVDMPDARKVHSVPVPRVGGWGIVIGGLVPLLIWAPTDPILRSFMIGGMILFAFGVWDDARNTDHWLKFGGQILAASVVVLYGGLYVSRLPFLDDVTVSGAIGKPFTIFAMVGAINAINHSDGLDGLAAGESLLSLIALAILGYLAENMLVIGVALAMVGGVLGFLRYNSHPARVFMGDAGSQMLGFTLAFLTIYLTQVGDTAVSAALPLLIIGVPISDILVVLYKRISGGMNWFRATRNHAHHRLLDLGFQHYQTVIVIYGVQMILVFAAVQLRYAMDAIVTGFYFLVIGSLFAAISAAERSGWRLERVLDGALKPLRSMARRLRIPLLLRELPGKLIAVAVPAFMLVAAVTATRVPRDVGIVAFVLASVIALEIARSRAVGSTLVRVAIYIAAVTCVYLMIDYHGALQRSSDLLAVALMVVLVAGVGGYLRFAADRRFGTTPTDYLILFIVLTLLVLANIDTGARETVKIVVYAVVLLYSCEVLIGLTSRRWNALHLSTLAVLTIIGVRGLL